MHKRWKNIANKYSMLARAGERWEDVYYSILIYSSHHMQNGNVAVLMYEQMSSVTYICIYVCVISSHSFWTSSSLDVPAGVTQEEGHAGFLIHLLSAVRALIFLARRIQPFLSLVDRKVEFCVLTI